MLPGENQTNVELSKESDFAELLRQEEEQIRKMCEDIAAFKPDVVITEKGLSDLAAHYLTKAGISAIRRLRKTDNNRIARATGATICHRTEELRESDIGTRVSAAAAPPLLSTPPANPAHPAADPGLW